MCEFSCVVRTFYYANELKENSRSAILYRVSDVILGNKFSWTYELRVRLRISIEFCSTINEFCFSKNTRIPCCKCCKCCKTLWKKKRKTMCKKQFGIYQLEINGRKTRASYFWYHRVWNTKKNISTKLTFLPFWKNLSKKFVLKFNSKKML